MWQKICALLFYRAMGWRKKVSIPLPDKCIICVAPHTSNWDFVIGQLYMRAEGFKSHFLMKKEWFFWPLGIVFKNIGGIPVYRSKHTSLTDQLSTQAKKSKYFHLCITPEGTRSRNPDWKKGFYYIALKADIPILLFGIDYSTHTIVCTKRITPKGEIDADMKEIKIYFKQFKGKHAERFTIGDIDN